MQHTIILCPLYHDEASFNLFAAAVQKTTEEIKDRSFSFLVVNDGTPALKLSTLLPLTIVHLTRNIGHQKAIAVGMAYAYQHLQFDELIIMDCDGEDRPEDLLTLTRAANGTDIIVARRASRQENQSFRFFYSIYKVLFRLLTGRQISFGNFMLLPRAELNRLVFHSEVWNHLAGGIVKSRIPYIAVSTHRGRRYAGDSKMNFTSLLLHGLGAIGVFIDVIAARVLVFSLFMILLSLLAIFVIVLIKLFTTRAIPGWATSAVSSMLIVLLQSFLLSLFTAFLYLSSQGQRQFIPAHHYQDYVRTVQTEKE